MYIRLRVEHDNMDREMLQAEQAVTSESGADRNDDDGQWAGATKAPAGTNIEFSVVASHEIDDVPHEPELV